MSTPVTNFGKVTVSTTYDAAATSIVLTAGHGSRLPSTFPYPLTWWNFTDYSDPADDPNREIVTVTNRAGDTLTVTRGVESTGASTKNTASKTYKMLLGITKAMWDALATQSLSQSFRGLRAQTHPDSNVAASKVLFSADAIVMSDGQEVQSWSNVVIDMATAGAGGLDTGTEQNSTWYELYAIYDGTNKKGCFHRAKDHFLDEDINAAVTEDATQGIRSAVDNSTVKVSQGFKVDVAGPVPFIDVKLIKVGTPTGNLYFTIESNSGGVPNNTPLATSVKIDASRILTTATWVRVPFITPASISAATQYHLVAQGDWTVNATNYIGWRMDGSAAAYANGSKALFDSDTSTWTADTDDDLLAKIYITENDVAFSSTVPSGYRYALIGYAYNDSSGNFYAYRQIANAWRYSRLDLNAQIVNEFSGSLTLIDLRAYVPPLYALTAIFGLTGTGTGATSASIGDIRATDIVQGTMTGMLLGLYAPSVTEYVTDIGTCPLSYSAVMADGGSGADLYILGFDW
jgi:hypothetical protein